MYSIMLAMPTVALGKLAWVSLRTGGEWTRYRQWDAVATNLALGAVFGGMAASLTAKALPTSN